MWGCRGVKPQAGLGVRVREDTPYRPVRPQPSVRMETAAEQFLRESQTPRQLLVETITNKVQWGGGREALDKRDDFVFVATIYLEEIILQSTPFRLVNRP